MGKVSTVECISFGGKTRTQMVTLHENMYCDIPEEYAIKLLEIYERTPHEKLNFSPEAFVCNVDSRIYTEWFMNPEEGNGRSLMEYNGEAFVKFVNDEIYHAIMRAQEKEIIKWYVTHSTYLEVRERVLEGLVKRGIELFSDWNGKASPPEPKDPNEPKDKRNLRSSLESYIGF